MHGQQSHLETSGFYLKVRHSGTKVFVGTTFTTARKYLNLTWDVSFPVRSTFCRGQLPTITIYPNSLTPTHALFSLSVFILLSYP
jgi:hypothetical protein